MKLTLSEDGPYIVEGDFRLLDTKKKPVQTAETAELCRCGKSGTSPLCDRESCDTDFGVDGDGAPPRWQRYKGTNIDVSYSARICIHDGACTFEAPEVFDPRKRPWADPKDSDAEGIAAIVRRCTSGALIYNRLDGKPQEQPEQPGTIRATRDGPFYLSGQIEIVTATGEKLFHGPRASLCRCGASRNKPFCDENHNMVQFKDP